MTFRMFAMLGLFGPALLGAQTTGIVQGRITDQANGQPLANAQVRIEGTVLGSLSDASGAFTIPNVPTGRRMVVARRIGYGEARLPIDVASGSPVTMKGGRSRAL